MQESPSIYLPQNIRFLRKQRGLSQGELAEKVGLNRGNIASYEKGVAEPKLSNLVKLAHLFRVSLCDITESDLQQSPERIVNGSADSEIIDALAFHADEQTVNHHLSKAEELQTVVSSLYHCHCFKLKNIETKDKNIQVLVSNFEQLYEVTHDLLDSHRELLSLVKVQEHAIPASA
ncbi:MAG: helix-turn-helix transcriptional regulator [Bacteroidota bacterium]